MDKKILYKYKIGDIFIDNQNNRKFMITDVVRAEFPDFDENPNMLRVFLEYRLKVLSPILPLPYLNTCGWECVELDKCETVVKVA